jgi:NitT/TauT family transport system substrate-binding protein
VLSRGAIGRWRHVALLLASAAGLPAWAGQPFVFVTNWTAQAEQGGYYAAAAEGLYAQAGLDVTLRMGGPQLNSLQLMLAGQADCVLMGSDLQVLQARAAGAPVVAVAAMFQKDPEVLITHADVHRLEDLAHRTILVSSAARNGSWAWLKTRYGWDDAQARPYTYNLQPFMADPQLAQQGYVTAEPYALQRAGVEAHVFLFADLGYPGYASTVACSENTLAHRRDAVAAFLKATALGWKRYLEDSRAADAAIRRDNPAMSTEQLAYSRDRLRELHLVSGGDAPTAGIGVLSEPRAQATLNFMAAAHLLDASRVSIRQTYDFELSRAAAVMP